MVGDYKQDYGELMREWLRDYGYEPKASGVQMIRCPLPGHEDKHPSCSVNTDKGVWKCFACDKGGGYKDLMRELGLDGGDTHRMDTDTPRFRSNARSRNLRDNTPSKEKRPNTPNTSDYNHNEYIDCNGDYGKAGTKIEYTWLHLNGTPAIQNRISFDDGTKTYTWSREQGPQSPSDVYYPATLSGRVSMVVVVEGAKCADYVYRLGYDAFAIVAAFNLPNDDILKKKLFGYTDIVLFPDNDEQGKKTMASLEFRLRKLKYPGRLFSVDISDMKTKQDIADLSEEEAKEKLAQKTRISGADGEEGSQEDFADPEWMDDEDIGGGFSYSDEKIGTEYPHRVLSINGKSGATLSLGEVMIFSAEGGIGKSTLKAQLASDTVRTGLGYEMDKEGREVLDGIFRIHTGGPVLILSYEDTEAAVKRRLLNAMPEGWDKGKLKNLEGIHIKAKPLFGLSEEQNHIAVKLAAWDTLEREVIKKKPRIVIIDPALSSFTGNSNQAEHVRAYIENLCDLAEENGCAIILVTHSNKEARKESDPFNPGQVGGSSHWVDRSRGVITLTRHKAGIQLSVIKANYGPSRYGIFIDAVHEKHVNEDWEGDDEGELLRFKRAGDWSRTPTTWVDGANGGEQSEEKQPTMTTAERKVAVKRAICEIMLKEKKIRSSKRCVIWWKKNIPILMSGQKMRREALDALLARKQGRVLYARCSITQQKDLACR